MNVKKHLISIMTMLILAIAAIFAIATVGSAQTVSAELGISLAEDIRLDYKVSGLPNNAASACIYLPNGDVVTKDVATSPSIGGAKMFSANVAIKNFKKNVKIEITDRNSNVLFTNTTNLADFCNKNYSEGEFKHLVEALEYYSDAASAYFNDPKSVTDTHTVDLSSVADMKSGGSVDGIKHASATLLLESKTAICHYFSLTGEKSIDAYEFYVDYDLDGRCDPGEELLPFESDGYFRVLVEDVTPNDLDRAYKLIVTDGESEYFCEYGALTYAKRIYAGAENTANPEATRYLVEGLYGYWQAADGLEGTITLKLEDGSTFGTFSYEYGVETPLVTDVPIKEGYAFTGWYSGSTKVESVSPATQSDISLTARFINKTVGTSRFEDVNAATLNYWKPHTHSSLSSANKCSICGHYGDCALSAAAEKSAYEAGRVTSCSDCGAAYTQNVRVYGNITSGDYASLNIIKNGTAVTYDYDYFVKPSNRYDAVDSYSRSFYNMLRTTGAKSVTFSVELSTYGDKPAIPFGMRVDGNSLKTFYVSGADNTVYLGDSTYAGNEKYAILKLTNEPQRLEIHFDFAYTYGSDVGSYTVYAENLQGERVDIKCDIQTLSIRFAQFSMVDGAASTGSSCALTINDLKFTADIGNGIVYPEGLELSEDAPTLYEYGTDTYIPDPKKYGEVFLGWYRDEALTEKINSVPRGAVGAFRIYDSWRDMTEEELAQEKLERIGKIKDEIAGIDKDFGDLPDFSAAYGGGVMPATPTVGEHPRLYIKASDLESIRANLTDPENLGSYEKVLAYAELDYDGRLATSYNGTNYTSASVAKLECLAFMYLVTGDELYGYTAIKATKNWLATVGFDEPEDSTEEYNLSNNASTAMYIIAKVYDWCHPLLTDEDKEYIVTGTANVLGPVFEVGYPPNLNNGVTGHSVGALVLRDWLSFCIATYDEYPEMYHSMVSRMCEIYVPAPNWYYPSGANFQGTSYGINKTYLHLISEMLLYNATGYKMYDVSFEPVINTYISYVTPDTSTFSLGDDYTPITVMNSELHRRITFYGSVYYKNPVHKAWCLEISGDYTKLGWSGRMELTPLSVLIMNDPTLKVGDEKMYDMPLVNYNGSPTGAITARSAWNDPSAWAVYMHIDESYGANHDHKDAGTFQIYYKGILALNSIRYDSYGSAIDFGYSKQTVSKNGLLIYNPKYSTGNAASGWIYSGGQTTQSPNNGENATLDIWLGKTTSHQANELGHAWGYDQDGALEYAYISGDITNAYDQDTVDLVKRSMISIATGNADMPMMFIVHDRIISDDASFKKTYLHHVTEAPVISGSVTTVTNTSGTNNGKLVNTTLLPSDASIEAIGGEGKYFWVNGKDLGENEPYRATVGWGRVEISTEGSREDSFLNVMYVCDADKNNAYVKPVLISSDTHEGAVAFGKCAMFSLGSESVSSEVSFTVDGDGELVYYVTGLVEGEWMLTVNGEARENITVDRESGAAIFTAPAGEISLTPAFSSISYVTGGGVIKGDYRTVRPSGDYTLPTDVTKPGYTFLGWYLDEALTERVTVIGSEIEGNVTVYAKYKKQSFYIVSDGGARTVTSNFGYIKDLSIGDMIAATESKCATLSIDFKKLDAADYPHVRNVNIRVRTSDGNNTVNPLFFRNGVIYAYDGNTAIADLASGDKIDVILDFDGNAIYYYVNGVYVPEATAYTVTRLTEDANGGYSGYNFVNTIYTFAQFSNDWLTSSGGAGKIELDSFKIYVGDLYEDDAGRNGGELSENVLFTRSNAKSSSEYYVESLDVGSKMIAANETAITFSLDLATSSVRTAGGIRIRVGSGIECEAYVFYFTASGVKTCDETVLTAYNSGDKLDAVIDFSAKTIKYYVNGSLKHTAHNVNISSDLTCYNYVTPSATATSLTRTNMFQLTNAGDSQTLAYDSIVVSIGDAYN